MNSDATIHHLATFVINLQLLVQENKCYAIVKTIVILCHKGCDTLLHHQLQSVTN
jgi:hypothetical protein